MSENTIFGDPIISDIKAELSKATIAWKAVADLLSKAEAGSGPEGFQSILKAVGLKKSKASKLISIARCQRFASPSRHFDTATTWTALYEVTTLSDAQFEQLLADMKIGDVLTHPMVQRVKTRARRNVGAKNKVAFSIRVTATAIRNGSITPQQLAELRAKLAEIASISPDIRVDDAELFEQLSSGPSVRTQSTDSAEGAYAPN